MSIDFTSFHSKYYAQIDLNPHQVEASLFAFNSPLSNGFILADEIGLSTTIEAGMIMCQYWAENRKRIIIIAPARANISALRAYVGKSGCMTLTKLKIHSFEDEEYLIASAITDSGDKLESEVALKLFEANASTQVPTQTNSLQNEIQNYKQQQIKQATQNSEEKNGEYFNAEIEKLDKWADDQLLSAEKELKELRKEINRERTQSRTAPMGQKLKIQMEIRNLEKKQQRLKREMEEAEDIIFAKRSEIIDTLAESLNQGMQEEELFTIRWKVI